MESSTRGDVAPGLAPDNGKTPADEIAEAGEAHGASAPGPTTAPHSAREGAQLKNNYQPAPNSMGSPPANSMGSMPDGTDGGTRDLSTGEAHGAQAPGPTTGKVSVQPPKEGGEQMMLSANSMGSPPANSMGSMPDGTDGSARDTSTGHARPASGAGLDHGRGATAAVAEHACQQPMATSWGSPPANSSGSVSCKPEGDAWPMSTGEAHGAHAPGSTTGEGPRQSLQSMACQQPTANSWGSPPANSSGSSETQSGAWSMGAGAAHGECISILNKTTSPGRAIDAGAVRAAASAGAAVGHTRLDDEPTPEKGERETRARGGSGAGMRPKQLFCMAAAEEEAAAEGAGPRVEGLTGLEGGMLLEWAEMEVGAAETSGSPTEPSNPSPSPSNPSPSSPGISPRPGPEPTDRSAGMTTGHGIAAAAAAAAGRAREHEDGPVTSPPLRAGVRGCVPACERTTRGRSAEATQRRDLKRSATAGEKRRRKAARTQRKMRAKRAAQSEST